MKLIKTITIATTLAAAGLAHAQSRQVPSAPQNGTVIIHNATIHPVSREPIANGFIMFEDGRITQIGSGQPSSGGTRIDAEGLHVYPGLIAPGTKLGLVETSAVDVTTDHNEMGGITPEVRAAVAINPDTDLIPVARANGVLLAMTAPDGGTVAGRAAVIRMDGWTWEDMTIDDQAGLMVSWPNVEPITAWWMRKSAEEQRRDIKENLQRLEDIFDDAEAYLAARENNDEIKTDLRFEAMAPFVRGEKPLILGASRAAQIESAVSWAAERGYKSVILGGHEADRVADLLLAHEVPVIVNGTLRMPGRRHSAYDEAYALPARLHELGVPFCIAPAGRTGNERNTNHHAAMAAAYGLSKDEALRSITLSAAEILGIGDDYGSLDKGKSATIMITDGDPLEMTTNVLRAFIDGREVDLGNRQKSMWQKYREKYKQRGVLNEG